SKRLRIVGSRLLIRSGRVVSDAMTRQSRDGCELDRISRINRACRRPQNNEYKNSPRSVNVPTNMAMKRLIAVRPRPGPGRTTKESTSRERKQRGNARSNAPIPAQPQSETPKTLRL